MTMTPNERLSIMELRMDRVEEVQYDHEKRLRHSEKNMYWAMGALAALNIILKFI